MFFEGGMGVKGCVKEVYGLLMGAESYHTHQRINGGVGGKRLQEIKRTRNKGREGKTLLDKNLFLVCSPRATKYHILP